jgi:ubiquitin C-terminal hydrolase
MFTIHEQLIGDNQYRCSACSNKLCDADKWAKISKLPPILTLPLQRFVYDIKTGNRQKKTTRYEFPFEIDLKEFCEVNKTKKNIQNVIFLFLRNQFRKQIMNYLLLLFIKVHVIPDTIMVILKMSIRLVHGYVHHHLHHLQ